MCGIAGFIGNDQQYATGCVKAMVSALARRGPDAEGIEVWSNAVLGHRRLSIFDLSDAGRQPMLSEDRSTGLVFNGAIYNFPALRKELETLGCRFHSQTDTEVLLHGYREWGIAKLISRIRGMFAIAIWDDRLRKLYLFRDRLGVKPLYFSRNEKGLAFASTARALKTAGVAGDIDPTAVLEFLEYGYVTDQRSIYQGVSKVAAGELIEFSQGQISRKLYWTPPAAQQSGPSFEEAVEETERLLLKAVEVRMFADVPVGALLSGGVDSSLICWAIAKLGGNLTAYTVGTPGDPMDESEDAAATARSLGIQHRTLNLSGEDIPGLQDMTTAYGEPFACASALGMLQISRVVKPEATVLLTGDGGDDVFLGYPEHKYFWMAQRLARTIPSPLAKLWYHGRTLATPFRSLRRPMHFVDYATGGLGALAAGREGLPEYRKHRLLGDRLASLHLWQREIPWTPRSGRNVLTEMLDYDRKGRFVGEYMTKVDGGTMQYALEARSPFLDQDLWEFAAALPYDLRLRGGVLKAVLRELARRRLGERVAHGRKRGFGIPVQRWLPGRWYANVTDTFQDSLLHQEGWIHGDAVLADLRAAKEKQYAPIRLWYLYVLESWLRYEKQAVSSASNAPAMATT